MASTLLREAAADLLGELEQNRLEVGVARLADGGGIRVVISCNAAWYRRLCGQYLGVRGQRGSRFRRPRTVIRRSCTVKALRRFLAGTYDPRSVYQERLRPFIEERAREVRRGRRPLTARERQAALVLENLEF